MNDYYAARKALWTSLRDNGATLQEIGDAYGVSSQRVSQVVGGPDGIRRGGVSRNPSAMLRRIRGTPTLRTIRPEWWETLVDLGVAEAVGRLLRARQGRYHRQQKAKRQQVRRQQDIAWVQSFTQSHGRSPTAAECVAHGIWFKASSLWPNPNTLLRAAKVPTRPRGRRAGDPLTCDPW